MDLRVPDVTITWAIRHENKLRLGHLAGNRFAIKIRDVNPTDVIKLRPVIDEIRRRGMPNFFGETTNWFEATGGITFSWGER